jgi:hypothetical protein
MAVNDLLVLELVRQMLADGKRTLKAEVSVGATSEKYFVSVSELKAGDLPETRSVLYPAATNVCKCCGK